MSNSYRIRTKVGVDKVLQVKLEQDFDTLEILSLAIFPNDVYLRNCSNFGTICGRVFCNRGLGLPNARVSIFIPIEEVDESNPFISSIYPYKSFEDFNEDGYKYNLLPYSQSHSGHVPVGTFPERTDVLTNSSAIEIYEKYYKFTAKTNDSGDYMIFGIPIGEYDLFMQVDLSDIGEFSLLPQDLLRMGIANESQLDGTKFKFSENYSELPQIITLKKVIQIAPFYGQKDICDYYITRADFDLTTEASIELKPTSVFMGSVISSENRKKLKRSCRVPAKQGWLCNLVAGPGEIETIRQTIFSDSDGRPILEEFRLENDGKLIDDNGTWLIELPMNLDYVYTDEDGNRRISSDGKQGVPTKAKYRFKIKWQQSPQLSEENRRGYFLVPNIKEWGWINTSDPNYVNVIPGTIDLPKEVVGAGEEPSSGPFLQPLSNSNSYYLVVGTHNILTYTVVVDGVENPNYTDTIPMGQLAGSDVYIKYTLSDPQDDGYLIVKPLSESLFQLQSSYAFSVDWSDYGTPDMIQEAIDCEDRFYEFKFNKVYTVSQLIDRYSNRFFPQKSIQIKHIIDSTCEGKNNPFPTNDAYYRFDILYILFSFVLTLLKPIGIIIIIILHVLAWLWPLWQAINKLIYKIQKFIYKMCRAINTVLPARWELNCTEPTEPEEEENPFVNIKLPLFLYTEDGCERCRCKLDEQNISGNDALATLLSNIEQLEENNTSLLADFPSQSEYSPIRCIDTLGPDYGGVCNISVNQNGVVFPAEVDRQEQLGQMYAALIAGSNTAEEPRVRRFPIWIGSSLVTPSSNMYFHSDGLPIAERLNLFNTKAKYFDNLNPGGPGGGTTAPVEPIFVSNVVANINIPNANGSGTIYIAGVSVLETLDVGNSFDPVSGTFTAPGDGTYTFSYELQFEITNGTGGNCFDENDDLVPCTKVQVKIIATPGNTPVETFYMGYETGPVGDPFFSDYFVNPTLYSVTNTFSKTLTTGQQVKLRIETEIGDFFLTSFSTQQWVPYEYNIFQGGMTITEPASMGGSVSLRCANSTNCNWQMRVNTGGIFVLDSGPQIEVELAPTGIDAGYKLSPGNTGWNQARVQWASDRPANANKYHYDNMLVLLVNQTGLTEGDMISFTSASKSEDTNKSDTYGTRYDTNTIRAKYANPIYGAPDPLLVTTYQIDDTPPDQQRNTTFTTPYAIDIEYFQVVKIMSILEYWALTSADFVDPWTVPPNNDVRFSLPWRFLRTHLGPEKGVAVCDDTDHPQILNSNLKFRNGSMVFATFSDFAGGWACSSCAGCFAGVTFQYGSVDPIRSYTGFSEGFNIVFVQRGVDPHSPRISIKYDLRRFFGINSNYDLPAINLAGIDISSQCIVEGQFRVNVPIQPGGTEYGEGNWEQTNPHGLRLMDHNSIVNNGQTSDGPPIFHNSQFFTYNKPDNGYEVFSSTTMTYYSALDRNAIYFGFGDDAYRWNPGMPANFAVDIYNVDNSESLTLVKTADELSPGLPLCVGAYEDDITPGSGPQYAQLVTTNGFTLTQSYYCSTLNGNVFITPRNNNPEGPTPCGSAISNYYSCCTGQCGDLTNDCRRFRHCPVWKHNSNDVSGYWYREYVEGGSCLGLQLSRYDNPWPANTTYGDFAECSDPTDVNPQDRFSTLRAGYDNQAYWSPVYASFTETDPQPNTVNTFFGGDVELARQYWYVKPNHAIEFSNKDKIVIRTDRLPSSTNLQKDELGSSYIMHQNSGFLIVIYADLDGTSIEEGTEASVPYALGGEVNFDNLPGGQDGNYFNVTESLVDCTKAVDLNSYYVDPATESPGIYEQGPHSREPADEGDYWWFARGMGCYNFVSKPFKSLKAHDVPGYSPQKYSDIFSIVELIQRLKLTFALCFEVISHTFSNNWINGTLYAFSFQNSTFFDSNNLPERKYCKDVIHFSEPLKSYFYRSSPWKGNDFIGKNNVNMSRGNKRNLLFPTTVMDLGPKSSFIQELVFSDEYDGFIASKIQPTSFQDVTDLLNLFVLSRLVNASFMQMLIPYPDDKGNEQGSDDPSIGAFFANSRWENGTLFASGLLPGLIDADYSQLISINSEFGVVGYGPEAYSNTSIFFGTDNGGYPVFGVLFSGSNQDRDYISPRRTIWREFAELPEQPEDFTYIPIKTQTVPFHQWTIFHNQDTSVGQRTIFGWQSNNFVTEPSSSYYASNPNFPSGFYYSPYQYMDRFNSSSNYFKPSTLNTFTYKGYILNYDETLNADGTTTFTPTPRITSPNTNAPFSYSFGAPFHFYFGLVNGGSALDRFIKAYIDTRIIYE